MKIIGVDNFCRDYISDILIVDKITNEYYAKKLIKLLEEDCKEGDDYFPRLVEDDYKLYDGNCVY